MSWFIKNIDLLDENHRLDDLLNLDDKKQEFLDRFSHLEKSSLIWVIAPFGSGKTTFLNQIEKDLKGKSHRVNFDAWKYPNRDDLREAFILETVKQIWPEKQLEKTKKIIKWKNSASAYIDIATDLAWWLSDWIGWVERLQNINIFDKFVDIFKKEPITKVYQFQNLLKSILDSLEYDRLYLVIEDIDRSWDAWIFFLETLSYFIKNQKIEKIITVIVPIWSEQRALNLNSYLKCLDYSRGFNLEWVNCDKLIDNLFEDNLFTGKAHEKWQMQTFFEWYFKEFSDQATMRLLKKYIREADLTYIQLRKKYGEVIDYRLCIMIEVAKNTFIKDSQTKDWTISYYNLRKRQNAISWIDSIFGSLLGCLIGEIEEREDSSLNSIYVNFYDHINWVTVKKLRSFDRLPIKIGSYVYPSDMSISDSIIYTTSRNGSDYYLISDIYFS